MSGNPLLRHITNREFALAAEYEALRDAPERRDAIRQELYKLRWRLNEANERMYHASGKGKAICHIDCFTDIETDKATSLSDNGIGIERMMDEIDMALASASDNRRRRYNALRRRLERSKAKHTTTTLRLIVANGRNRTRSIQMLSKANRTSLAAAKAKYWFDLHTIERFVGVKA